VPPSASVALLNDPPSAVTVWGALSVLVHVSVVPLVTASVTGAKAKLTIEAAVLPSLVVGCGVGFGVALGVGAVVAVGFGVGFGVGADASGFEVGCGVALLEGAGVGRAEAVDAGAGFSEALGAADPPPFVLYGEALAG
jgi:hypothetical protein